jgi:hypothetical protein
VGTASCPGATALPDFGTNNSSVMGYTLLGTG